MTTTKAASDQNLPRGADGERHVQAMFGRIAGIYDRLNTLMTAGLHHVWRRRAVDLAEIGPGDRVIDVATGTGELAFEAARRVGTGGEIVAVDYSAEMLAVARRKDAEQPSDVPLAPIHFEQANALLLPHPNASFDAATVGFGARNFSDTEQGLREMVRVVRPGGKVVVLEVTTPRKFPLSLFFSLWLDRFVPLMGVVLGDPDAYRYLPSSVRRFPAPAALAAKMSALGLVDIRYILTGGGIISIHVGTVPPK